MSNSRTAFVREARKIHRDSLFNATAHFEAAQRLGRVHVITRLFIVVFGAVGGLGALKDPGLGAQLQLVLVGVSSTMAGLLGGVLAVLRPAEAQNRHELAGKQFKSLQHDARRVHEVFAHCDDDAELETRVSSVMERYNQLNEGAPQIPDAGYERAKRKILAGEFENVPPPTEAELDPASKPTKVA